MFDTETGPRKIINKSRTTWTFLLTLTPAESMHCGEFPQQLFAISRHSQQKLLAIKKTPSKAPLISLPVCPHQIFSAACVSLCAQLVPSLQHVDMVILFHFLKEHFVHKTIDVKTNTEFSLEHQIWCHCSQVKKHFIHTHPHGICAQHSESACWVSCCFKCP